MKKIYIPFHKTTFLGQPSDLTEENLLSSQNFCENWFVREYGLPNFFFTKSCTQSLELAILSLNLPIGSEVIMPSYAFVSLANAVNNFGYKCVFVDTEEDTMNICTTSVEKAISKNTKAIIAINYSGIPCNYTALNEICKRNNLFLVEDNAHGLLSEYKNKKSGNFGDIAVFSFDHMKNISCGQGGGICINNKTLLENFNIAYQLGTNRVEFLSGKVKKYEWYNKGLNCNLSFYLYDILEKQLKSSQKIFNRFQKSWNLYNELLEPLKRENKVLMPKVPEYTTSHNAHIFWFKLENTAVREQLQDYLHQKGVIAYNHYPSLAHSYYGQQVAKNAIHNKNLEDEVNRLLRLPLYYELKENQIKYIVKCIFDFFSKNIVS